jgi:hypothetical protein
MATRTHPHAQVGEAVQHMLEVIDAAESAMQAGNGGAGSGPGDDVQPVLGLLLDALMDACQRSAEALRPDAPSRVDVDSRGGGGRSAPSSARATYLINCMSTAATALGARRSGGPVASQLSGAAEQQVRALVEGEVRAVLARVGCADILDRLLLYRAAGSSAPTAAGVAGQAAGAGGVLPVASMGMQTEGGGAAGGGSPASDPSLSHTRIVEGLRAFFMLLSSPDALPEFQQIQVCGVVWCGVVW